ncbi:MULTISPECIES: glycosyltransferase [Micrococcaceae]|uniref:glycosyltransferase n=1 Tax=Micrococcaceae TaxID=1268 RepID=UPI001035C148|nr:MULTISPECIES: glycosyltransferase [Micrococcaceae]TAP25719.1 glycosyltransferase family 4 protein [Arthrobacter sp. S41]UXN31655.1 glycosyltransferase [Glutamicibacter sp. M10]
MPVAEEKPLTIVIAADTYLPNVNGAAMFCYRLATEMHARGHRVHVLAVRGDDGKTFTEIRDEAIVHRLKSHSVPTHEYFRIVAPWEVNRQIDKLLADIKPDVIHAQSHYMIGQRSVGWAKKNKVRSVATNHFMPENLDPFLPFPQWFKRIVAHNSWKDMGKIFGRADAVTTPTPLAAKAMRERAKLMNVLPLSNGIEVGNYELAPGEQIIKNDFPTILFAGRLAVEKNIHELIEALPLMTQVPDAIIEIVGGGEQRVHLEKIADDLGIRDRVRFLGLVSDEELRQAYLRCDVFCQPGTAELQSLVTLEALSASRPVVLANAMALPHLVDEGVNGYMFKPGDRQDLADKLDRILALSEDERAKLGQAGHRKVMNHAQRKTMDSFEALYRGEKVSTH